MGGLQTRIPRWLGSDPLSAWWLGLAPATLEFWVRFPNERNQGKTGAPCVKVPGSSRVPSFIAHVLHSPPPPPANSFVIGPAVINTTGQHPGGGDRDGMDLGSVTLKRIGFFVFQLNTQHTRSVWAAAHRSVWAAAHSCASRGGAGNVREISRNRHPGLW